MKVIKCHLFNAYHWHPRFLLNITPHLILTATLEERSYDPYVEKTQELSGRTQTHNSLTLKPMCSTEFPLVFISTFKPLALCPFPGAYHPLPGITWSHQALHRSAGYILETPGKPQPLSMPHPRPIEFTW